MLKKLAADERTRHIPVLIQTNGIEIGRGRVGLGELISASSQPYLFELSFKGTSREEFRFHLHQKSAG